MISLIKKLFSKRLLLVTHNGNYHTDDVFACATLQLVLDKRGVRSKVVRTRDPLVIEKGDIVWDVGGVYNTNTKRFDHHQQEGAGVRENSIPYASFGLIWKEYGIELCDNKEVFDSIEKEIVQGVDAIDNGVSIYEKKFEGVSSYGFHDFIGAYAPSFSETFSKDEAFSKAVDAARFALMREIKKRMEKQELKAFVEDVYQKTEDKRLIVFDKHYPWKEVLSSHPEPLFVVSEDSLNERWMLTTVRDDWASFVNRKDMPKEWGGLRDEEFEKVSGVPGAVFCHKGLWLAGAKTKEGALALAQKSLAS